jgi:hypothetical protein
MAITPPVMNERTIVLGSPRNARSACKCNSSHEQRWAGTAGQGQQASADEGAHHRLGLTQECTVCGTGNSSHKISLRLAGRAGKKQHASTAVRAHHRLGLSQGCTVCGIGNSSSDDAVSCSCVCYWFDTGCANLETDVLWGPKPGAHLVALVRRSTKDKQCIHAAHPDMRCLPVSPPSFHKLRGRQAPLAALQRWLKVHQTDSQRSLHPSHTTTTTF